VKSVKKSTCTKRDNLILVENRPIISEKQNDPEEPNNGESSVASLRPARRRSAFHRDWRFDYAAEIASESRTAAKVEGNLETKSRLNPPPNIMRRMAH
jgi:hypothetical protein